MLFVKMDQISPNYHSVTITANGPAMWGGCVTRPVLTEASGREHRVESWYFSQKAGTVQGGYGAVFGVMVKFF